MSSGEITIQARQSRLEPSNKLRATAIQACWTQHAQSVELHTKKAVNSDYPVFCRNQDPSAERQWELHAIFKVGRLLSKNWFQRGKFMVHKVGYPEEDGYKEIYWIHIQPSQ